MAATTVTHDALPTHTFQCDGIDTETWNGSAVPFWRSGEVCADVADTLLGDDGRALYDGENDVVLIDYWLSEESETVGRDADGMFRLHGWTFTTPDTTTNQEEDTMATTITRTEQGDTIAYGLVIGGHEVSELVIDAATRKVVNVETSTAHRGQGHARTLWEHANTEAHCFHAVEHHRTPEGDAFANAVGGETIPADLDIIDTCCVCCGDYDEEI